jgi:predicted DNA binding CopG/RHH family protein
MKITNIATTIMTVAVILAAFSPANAEVASKTISAQSAFTCPSIRKDGTPHQRAAIRELLPPGAAIEDPAQLNASVEGLKRLGLSKILTTDHLIGAYCTNIARNKLLSDTEKAEDVREFAAQVTQLVYNDEDISDISLNVLLKPSAVDAVNVKAQASGLSAQQWMSRIIEAAAQQR